ncbi:MAG: hemerythrin domain-containing protein [Ignavibacteria bacterium]
MVSNHHTYIRKTFKELLKQLKAILKTKNNSVQNEEIIKYFEKLNLDFEIHMQKEEKLLFPYIKRLVDSEYSETEFEIAPFGLIKNQLLS